ncbi:MAG: RIP metalloprotease RseP [Bdellovibrionales bacterium]|nr:RIP metalloprotease RseP [Bdellovibrionales bacterium]
MSIIQWVLYNVGPFFILLGLLIFIHELGHFLVAKYFNVRVETFSLGFGKKILSYKKGETTYCVSLIPLGGYVKMFGDDPNADVPEAERDRAFLHKPVSQRIAVVLAGPLMNLFFAVLLFTIIGAVGEQLPGPYAGDVATDSKAYADGFRSGDKIVSINGQATPSWTHVKKKIESMAGKAMEFVVERKGESQPLKFDAAATTTENENIFSRDSQVGTIQGLGMESRSSIVGVKDPKSPAGLAGIQPLDLLVTVDGQKVTYWRDLQPTLAEALKDGKTTLTLQVRDLEAEDKPEALRTVTLNMPAKLDKVGDLPEQLGLEPAELYIYQTKKDSPAAKVGIQPKDRVIKVGGEPVTAWSQVLERVKAFDPTKEAIEFTVLRNGEEKAFQLKPEMTKFMTMKGQEESRYTIGIQSGFVQIGPEPIFHRLTKPIEILKYGVRETANWTEFVVMSMVRLVTGDVSAKNIGGVITIGRVAAHSFEAGLSTFLRTMAIISINLFLLNLLPIPVLDGGHLVFYAYEGLRGAPMSMRKMELAQQIGLMILMCLMVFAFFNDITNYIFNRW